MAMNRVETHSLDKFVATILLFQIRVHLKADANYCMEEEPVEIEFFGAVEDDRKLFKRLPMRNYDRNFSAIIRRRRPDSPGKPVWTLTYIFEDPKPASCCFVLA